jgi:prepilin-type N-terminal cleavage/methylation domain-containing protein/prepilin-type processing-associated H-X9-DG protein
MCPFFTMICTLVPLKELAGKYIFTVMRHTLKSNRSLPAGFTLIELLVVIAIIAILAAMLLPALSNAKESSKRAACANNLKQISYGIFMYAGDNGDHVPFSGWKYGSTPPGNPWETHEVCRYSATGKDVATGGMTEGPYGMGVLFFNKLISNPQSFYCPDFLNGEYAYQSYNETAYPWPAIPADYSTLVPNFNGDPYVQCSYSYYPQAITKNVNEETTDFGKQTLPAINTQSVIFVSPNPNDPVETAIDVVSSLKTSQIDVTKSMVTDILEGTNQVPSGISHTMAGQPAGVNVCFGDGHVRFVPVKGNNVKKSYKPFDPDFWYYDVDNTVDAFQMIVNSFQP